MGLRHVYIPSRCFSTDFWSPCGRGGFLVILLFRRRADICCEKGGRQWPTSLSAPGQMDRLGCVWRPPSCGSSIRVLRVSTVSSPVAILAHLSHVTEDEESIHETLKLQSRSQIFWKILKNSPLSGHFAALPNNLRWEKSWHKRATSPMTVTAQERLPSRREVVKQSSPYKFLSPKFMHETKTPLLANFSRF